MAQQIDNGYNGTHHPADGKTRTNPWASDFNGVQLLGIERQFGYFNTAWDYAITGNGATTTMTPQAGNNAPVPKYFKWVITDENGNEAYGALDTGNPAVAVAIDTSALDATDKWYIIFNAEKNEADGGEKVMYNLMLNAGDAAGNGTGSVNF